MLGKVVAALDPKAKTVMLKSGETLNYDAALIATGAHLLVYLYFQIYIHHLIETQSSC